MAEPYSRNPFHRLPYLWLSSWTVTLNFNYPVKQLLLFSNCWKEMWLSLTTIFAQGEEDSVVGFSLAPELESSVKDSQHVNCG